MCALYKCWCINVYSWIFCIPLYNLRWCLPLFWLLSLVFCLQTEKLLLTKCMRKTLIIPYKLNNLRCYFGPRQTELMRLKCRICSALPGSLILKKAHAVMMYWSHRYHKMQHILFFFNRLFSGTEYHAQTMFSMLALNLLQIEIQFSLSADFLPFPILYNG